MAQMEEVLSFVQPGDEGLFAKRTMPKVLCCVCGVTMDSNPANMCVNCLRTQVDITEGIPKQLIIHSCRGCQRYLRPPWVAADLESKELLAICLKKINGLNRVKLVDAGFIWTEPHSRHIKVKLTIQKDVLSGVKLQQVFAVDFAVQNQQCDACQRSYTEHHWRAQVQVRQKVEHKKTFYLLEQLILKHRAHEKCSGVEQVPSGVDFNFLERSHSQKFIDFLDSVVPMRVKAAKQLVSEDIHSSVRNYKFNYAVEIVPLCRDDLVVVPSRIAAAIGNINPLALVFRVATVVFFVDPRSLQIAEVNAERYFKEPFRALMSTDQLIEFTVLDITPVTVAPLTGAALRRKQGRRALKQLSASGGGSSASSMMSGSREAGKKRPASSREGGGEDGASLVGGSSVGPSTFAGGFTGAVSLAGGSVHFNGGMSTVASTVTGGPKGKLLLADAEVVRTRDLGTSDERFIVRTHLGNIIRPGDTVLGYDVSQAVYNDADAESHAIGGKSARKGTSGRGGHVDMPDVILVRKVHKKDASRADAPVPSAKAKDGDAMDESAGGSNAAAGGGEARRKTRVWKLKRFDDVMPNVKHSDVTRRGDEERQAEEYEAFLRDVESDPALRKTLNLYKNKEAIEAAAAAKAGAAAAAAERLRAKLTAGGMQGESEGEDEEEEEEEGEEGEDGGSIGLEELLDEMDIGTGGAEGDGAQGGAEDGEEDGAWGGTPAAVEPGFEGEAAAGRKRAVKFAAPGAPTSSGGGDTAASGEAEDEDDSAEYDDGGLSLTKAGRKNLGTLKEQAEDDEDL